MRMRHRWIRPGGSTSIFLHRDSIADERIRLRRGFVRRPRDPFGCLKRGSGHNDLDLGRISLKAQGAGLICYLLLSAEVNPDTPRGMLPARLEVFIRRRQTDFVVSNDQEDWWYFRAVIS